MKHRNILIALTVLLCMTFGTAWAADTQENSIKIGFKLIHNYTISYDLAGGTVSEDNPTSYTIESENFTLMNPTSLQAGAERVLT